jgi:DUF4097 and DUF4098 domain-containing protein YvlB
MKIRTHVIAATLLLGCAWTAAAELVSTERATRELPIYLGGTFVLENTAGDIDLMGTDDAKVVISIEKTVHAVDKVALEDGVQHTLVRFGGDETTRLVQTLLPPPVMRTGRWLSAVKYTIRVPRTVHVRIVTTSATHISVTDIRGNVFIKSFDGLITVQDVTGPSLVATANGNIVFIAPARSLSDATLSTVNGDIEVRAPRDANFQWVGEAIKGDVRTTFPARIAFMGSKFHGAVNAPGGPTITTQTIMGNVSVLQNGTKVAAARSLRDAAPENFVPSHSSGVSVRRVAETIRREKVQGTLSFTTILGNVSVDEVRGNVNVTTGAGEVQLGSVFGSCQVTSFGGPLNLGDILGTLTARTEAGDILVQAARTGGTIITGGGTIRLLYTGGETRLQSGGGDIVVRQAAAPINAETQSGDISITVDPGSKTETITAKTAKGNVRLNVAPGFAADIDATVITSDPDSNNVVSDLTGLQIRREQIGGKTRIRATGKVNGGGERVDLYAEDGGIQITARAGAPITILTP